MSKLGDRPAGTPRRKFFPGMERNCPRCDEPMIVTESMCRSRSYTCAPCMVKYVSEYIDRNREKKREWNRAYSKRNSHKMAAKTRAYRNRNPEKKKAWQDVQTALRNGTLKREPCEVCGKEKAHAHHDDYTKTLDVIWLCHQHHMARHDNLAALESETDND